MQISAPIAATPCTSFTCGDFHIARPTSSMPARINSAVCERSPHSSCSWTAARTPGMRSIGPCAAVPDRVDTNAASAAISNSVFAAGLIHFGRPSSEITRKAAPMTVRTIVK